MPHTKQLASPHTADPMDSQVDHSVGHAPSTAPAMRQATPMLVVVGGFDGSDDLTSVEVCSPSPGHPSTWNVAAGGMRTVRSAAGTAVSGGRVYVAGGSCGSASHSAVESFAVLCADVGTYCEWRHEPSMAVARMAMSLTATSDGSLWATGGYVHDSGGSLATVERLTPGAAAWEALPEMKSARCSFGAVESGGAVLAFGGYGATDALAACESCDPRTATWSPLPPMSQRRSCLTAAPVGQHRVLVCGGHDGTKALALAEIFDQRANKWEVVPEMPTARSGPAAVADGKGRVWVLGGYPDGTAAGASARALHTSEVWDNHAFTWSTDADMQRGRTGAGAVTLHV